MLKMMKFSELNTKLQNLVKVIGALMFLSPLLITCVKKSVPYIKFVIAGPELVENVDELKKSLFVLTGVVAANSTDLNNNEYYLYFNKERVIGRIKVTKSGNKYIFVPSEGVGERAFSVNYNDDMKHWYFIDFTGAYKQLYEIK